MKKILILITIIMLITPVVTVASSTTTLKRNMLINQTSGGDIDPLVDLFVTVEIKQIRSLEQTFPGFRSISKIDRLSDPDFYVKVFINNEEFTSPIWYDTKYVYTPEWSATADVPDDVEFVNVTIELWDDNPSGDRLCDLSGSTQEDDDDDDDDDDDGNATNELPLFDNRFIVLGYNLKTGHWTGDDWLSGFWGGFDPSGYGRLNGCDDNSYDQNDRDCELLFDIYQNDFDHDNIPYWTEVNAFKTDPTVDNTGEDFDNDGGPIEWEWKWGYSESFNHRNHTQMHYWKYDPFIWEDHETLDDDEDGIQNVEEYRMADWGADPFRKDLFVELDQMEAGSNGEPASLFPEGSKELLRTAYNKHNVVYHLDDGSREDSGSDRIPFDNLTTMDWFSENNELDKIYTDYFLHGNPDNWRRSVFHYGVLIYQCSMANGNAFGGGAYQISYNGLSEKATSQLWLTKDTVFASAYMHECGHSLAIENAGVDDQNGKYPWEVNFWKWLPYKSVMNYGYMFRMVDYSDGSRGKNDFNDWYTMDLTAFETDFP